MKEKTNKGKKTIKAGPAGTPAARKKREKATGSEAGGPAELSAREIRKLGHELDTHRIELEMQNEELRRVQNELEVSCSRYADLYDYSPVGYFIFDKKGLIREVNLTGADLLGGNRSTLVSKPFSSFVDRADRRVFRAHCAEVLKTHAMRRCEIRLSRKDGTRFYAQLQSIPIKDSDGLDVSLRTTLSDIAEQKRAEEALRESERQLSDMLSSISDAFVSFDLEWRYTYVNDQAVRMLRTPRERMLGKTYWEVFPESAESEFDRQFRRAVSTGETVRFEAYYGPLETWFLCTCYPSSSGMSLYFQDITGRKEAEEALRQSREDLDRAQEVGQIGWWRLDVQKNVLTWSDENHRIFGIPKGTPLTYEAFLSSVHPDDREYVDTQWKAGLAGRPYDIEHRIVAEGKTKWVREKAYLEFDGSGSLLGGFGISQDITGRKEAEESLKRAKDELEERVRVRTAELQGTTELLERVFSTTEVMLAYMDRDFDFIRVNRAYADMDNRDPEFYEGKHYFDLFPEDETGRIFRRVLETGEPYFAIERPFDYADHPERGIQYWDWSLLPVKGTDGRINGLLLSLIDVTDRRRAEDKMYLFRSLMDQTSDAIAVVSPLSGRILDVNRAAVGMSGYSREELLEMEVSDLAIRFRDRTVWDGLVLQLRDRGSMLMEEWARRKGGSVFPVEASVKFITLEKKDYMIAVIRDITERRDSVDRMQVTNELLKLFSQKITRKEYLDAVVDFIRRWSGCCCTGIRIIDGNGNIPYESYAGFSREFWETENMLSSQKKECVCSRAVTGAPVASDRKAMTANGSYFFNNTVQFFDALSPEEQSRYRGVCVSSGFISLAVIPIRYHDRVLGAIHLADRKEGVLPEKKIEFLEMLALIIGEALFRFGIEDDLRQNYSLLENIFSNIHLQTAYMDRDFNFIKVNPLYAESHGFPAGDLMGKNYFSLHPGHEDRDIFVRVRDTGRPHFGYAEPFRSKDSPDSVTFWDWSLQPVRDASEGVIGLVLSCLDVTEKIHLQSETIRAGHLASLGELAAGVAHEINNPINGIINYAQILVDRIGEGTQENRIAGMIIEEGARIATIVKSLLSFARDRQEEKGPVSLRDVLSDALSLSGAQIQKEGTTLEIDMPGSLPLVRAHARQLLQVFLNVISNARYALNAKYPGRHPEKVLRIAGEADPGDSGTEVRVTFHDRGIGISSAIIDKIMNPFFTTKPPGKGTGLGLSISHGIISDHGGRMSVTSREGEYTTVTISLPAYRVGEQE